MTGMTQSIKRWYAIIAFMVMTLLASQATLAWHQIKSPDFKSLQVIVNNDFKALPVMELGSDDILSIGFDEMSHNYHRLTYHIEPCNPDWSTNTELFDSDWLEGFNDMPIEDYQNSLNTTVLYTHYHIQLPNENTRLKMSGNYRVHIIDEDDGSAEVIVVQLRVVEQVVGLAMTVTTNTDVDLNQSHQQLSLNLTYNALRVTDPDTQVQTFLMQNGREDNMKVNIAPNYKTTRGLTWEHNRNLIFAAGNEYRKFEVLDPSHPTMGLFSVTWDEAGQRYHAVPFIAEPRRSYIYDRDANGAFLIRNSDNVEIHYTSDYVWVHYFLKAYRRYDNAIVRVNGRWACGDDSEYTLSWNDEEQGYDGMVLQKLGYYNYQFLLCDIDGTTHTMPEEGSFYQTENDYEAFVYFRGTGDRSWRLVGYSEITKAR